jgi:hypothetical protein
MTIITISDYLGQKIEPQKGDSRYVAISEGRKFAGITREEAITKALIAKDNLIQRVNRQFI